MDFFLKTIEGNHENHGFERFRPLVYLVCALHDCDDVHCFTAGDHPEGEHRDTRRSAIPLITYLPIVLVWQNHSVLQFPHSAHLLRLLHVCHHHPVLSDQHILQSRQSSRLWFVGQRSKHAHRHRIDCSRCWYPFFRSLSAVHGPGQLRHANRNVA